MAEYDFAAGYRAHAQRVQDGELAPQRALLVEFDATGIPLVFVFGRLASPREAVGALLHAATHFNAIASN